MRQGVCDLGQAARIRNSSKAVPLLDEADPGRVRLAGDVLVAVEQDLGAERRAPRPIRYPGPPPGRPCWGGVGRYTTRPPLPPPGDPPPAPRPHPHPPPRP